VLCECGMKRVRGGLNILTSVLSNVLFDYKTTAGKGKFEPEQFSSLYFLLWKSTSAGIFRNESNTLYRLGGAASW
ncbi:hypothetical protein, partial [Parasphingorhabdus sp.]